MDTAMDMERGKLKPPLPLMPRLPQDIIMDIIAMAVMATTDMVMERERPRLRLATITDIMEDMVVMDIMDMVMERGRLSPVIIMDTLMDMAMDMVTDMDTMVKQQ